MSGARGAPQSQGGGGGGGSGGAWETLLGYSLPGIAYPTDPVPSAIMPTLPTGADFDTHEWINTYDPLTYEPTAPPEWPSAEAANYYYIDKYHPSATDTGNTYGYPNQPRLTIPAAAYGSSAIYVEVRGNNVAYSAGAPEYNVGAAGASVSVTLQGSTARPAFWKGVNAPRVGAWFQLQGARHVIFDGIYQMEQVGSNRPFGRFHIGQGSEYICFRNGEIRGDGTLATSNTAFSLGGESEAALVQFVVCFNTHIHEIGSWNNNPDNRDAHICQPNFWLRYFWLVSNELNHGQADCIQCGNSENTIPDPLNPACRAHYVYIADNDMYETHENAIDNKNSYHVISCKNRIHDFTASPPTPTAYLISNNSEGTLTGFHWSLFDEIFDCKVGVRCSGNQTDDRSYMIGLRMWNIGLTIAEGYAFRKEADHPSAVLRIVNSSIYNINGSGMTDSQTEGTRVFRGDVFHTIGQFEQGNGATTAFDYNVRFNQTGQFVGFDTQTGSVVGDPQFVDPANGDFRLQSTSPARGIVPTIDPLYDTFESMYGLSIKVDALGNPLPATNLDAGAIQFSA